VGLADSIGDWGQMKDGDEAKDYTQVPLQLDVQNALVAEI